MITEQQERNLSNASANVKHKQDKVNPHVINIHDGRLMPNTPRLRVHKDYRIYTGPKGPDIGAPERLRWLAGALRQLPMKVVNSKAEADTFDVGTATKDELVVFAQDEFGHVLDASKDVRTLRKEVMALATSVAESELT